MHTETHRDTQRHTQDTQTHLSSLISLRFPLSGGFAEPPLLPADAPPLTDAIALRIKLWGAPVPP